MAEQDNTDKGEWIVPDKSSRFVLDEIYNCTSIESFTLVQSKIEFYKKQKQDIKFRLITKKYYEIKGLIENIYFDSVEIASTKGKIIIYFSEIDPSTILPINYEPIAYLPYDPIKQEDRDYWINKYNGRCAYMLEGCKGHAEAIDHIFPQILGGRSNRENLRPICNNCNSIKGAKIDIFPKELM